MRLSSLLAAVATCVASMGASVAGEVTLYTWRQQEVPLWDYLNHSKLLGDTRVNVVQFDSDDYEKKLGVALRSPGVDLFQGRGGAAKLGPLIDAGVLKPTGIDLSGMAPAALDAARGPDGQFYGVPFAVQMESFLYNTGVFAEHGITVPKSLKELKAASLKLKAAGLTPISFGAASGWWLGQVVGEAMTAGLVPDELSARLITGEACFTDPAFVATLQTVKDWQTAGLINASAVADDYGAMRTSVAAGESAMMLDGIWSTGPVSPMYKTDPDLKLGFFPVPGGNGKVYAFGDGAYLVNATSANAAEAQRVLEFTTTRKFAEAFAKYVGELPAFGGAYKVGNPLLKQVAAAIAGNSAAPTPFFAYALNKHEPSYGTLVSDGYLAMLSGKLTPAGVAKKIQDGLNSWNYVGAAHCRSQAAKSG